MTLPARRDGAVPSGRVLLEDPWRERTGCAVVLDASNYVYSDADGARGFELKGRVRVHPRREVFARCGLFGNVVWRR